MGKKYELTENEIGLDGIRLKQIRYLIDIPKLKIKAGDLGGYLESEANLSQGGWCVVLERATVSGEARVSGDAKIRNNSKVQGFAVVTGKAILQKEACVEGHAEVRDNALISGEGLVNENAKITGKGRVTGTAVVTDDSLIHDAKISGRAHIGGKSEIKGWEVTIGGHSSISDSSIEGKCEIREYVIIKESLLSGDESKGLFLKGHARITQSTIGGDDICIENKARLNHVTFQDVYKLQVRHHAQLSFIECVCCSDLSFTHHCVVIGESEKDNLMIISGNVEIMGRASIKGAFVFMGSINLSEYAEMRTAKKIDIKDDIQLSGDRLYTGITL